MDSTNPDPGTIPDDELELQNYQDDLDTSSSIHDAFTTEHDDPTAELGVDPHALKEELDHYSFEDGGRAEDEDDDRREQLEDLDEDGSGEY